MHEERPEGSGARGSRAAPLPAHERVGAGGAPARWILFLHGIFGAGRNWATVARRLVERRPEWGAVLVDLRLHGASRGFPPPHTLAACAADVSRLAADLEARDLAVLGHSFGGKVALLAVAAGLPGQRQAWIVDADPGPARGGSAVEMLRALRELPPSFARRAVAVDALVGRGFARPVAEWMATNLEASDGGFRWRLDLAGLGELLEDFGRTDAWPLVERPPGGVELHFVKAEGSNVLPEPACARLRAAGERAAVHLHRVRGGHWVNVDAPEEILRRLAERLP